MFKLLSFLHLFTGKLIADSDRRLRRRTERRALCCIGLGLPYSKNTAAVTGSAKCFAVIFLLLLRSQMNAETFYYQCSHFMITGIVGPNMVGPY